MVNIEGEMRPANMKTANAFLNEVEEIRVGAMADLNPSGRATLGQFFTPRLVAIEMARMIEQPQRNDVRLLDPGAGSGILSAAAVERFCAERQWGVETIAVDAYELDPTLRRALARTLSATTAYANDRGITVTWRIHNRDFVSAVEDESLVSSFDVVITNPPYKKIGTSSAVRASATRLGAPVVNLYAAFLVASVTALREGGQLIAITPRSFSNGTYYRPFREFLFDRAAFSRMHVYESRALAFVESDVLQENVIYSLGRGAGKGNVVVSMNDGPGHPTVERTIPHEQVIDPGDPDLFIHLPLDSADTDASLLMASLPAALDDLGISVSTGKVVDFRVREELRMTPESGAVPLLYPLHLQSGCVTWPVENAKKPNSVLVTPRTERLLLPNGAYTLVKRFSSKEERRRVNASMLMPCDLNTEAVAFENHLNVFHRENAGLRLSEAIGLTKYLSSTLVDQYVRQFNGHTQINAGDLRRLRYPSLTQLRSLGQAGREIDIGDTRAIDNLIERFVTSALRR